MGSAGKGEAWAFGTMLGILKGIWRHGQKTQDVGPCGMGQLIRSVQCRHECRASCVEVVMYAVRSPAAKLGCRSAGTGEAA